LVGRIEIKALAYWAINLEISAPKVGTQMSQIHADFSGTPFSKMFAGWYHQSDDPILTSPLPAAGR
jgi:hypothetical protein